MKKIMIAVLVAVAMVVFVGCSSTNKLEDMQIRIAQLTKEESDIVNLLGSANDNKIYEYQLDENIKTIAVNYYELSSDATWVSDGGLKSEVTTPTGKIFIENFGVEGAGRIAIQTENGISSLILADEYHEKNRDTSISSVTSWGEIADIVKGEQIPLGIQVVSSENGIASYDVASFFDTTLLEGNDSVYAVTVTFS